MSEEGTTRRTTRSLARRLSTDSISPPAAATPGKKARASKVTGLPSIAESKSKAVNTRKSRRLSTDLNSEEPGGRPSTPILTERRRSRRLSIDLDEQRPQSVSTLPIVEVIHEEEDINILTMKDEIINKSGTSVVDQFAVTPSNTVTDSMMKETLENSENKLTLENQSDVKESLSISEKEINKEFDEVFTDHTEKAGVQIEDKKSVDKSSPDKPLPSNDYMPEPMEVDTTTDQDMPKTNIDKDQVIEEQTNTQQVSNTSYSSDSSNVSTRSRTKLQSRISTSIDDLTKDSISSDSKKNDLDASASSGKELNISTRSRRSLNESQVKEINKLSDSKPSDECNISTRSKSKLNVSNVSLTDTGNSAKDTNVAEDIVANESRIDVNISTRSKSKLNVSSSCEKDVNDSIKSLSSLQDSNSEKSQVEGDLIDKDVNIVQEDTDTIKSERSLNVSTRSKSKLDVSDLSISVNKDTEEMQDKVVSDKGDSEKSSSGRDLSATEDIAADKTVESKNDFNISTRSKSKLNTSTVTNRSTINTDSLKKAPNDIIMPNTPDKNLNCSTGEVIVDIKMKINDQAEYAEFERSLNSSAEEAKKEMISGQNSNEQTPKLIIDDSLEANEPKKELSEVDDTSVITKAQGKESNISKGLLNKSDIVKTTLTDNSKNEISELMDNQNDLSCNKENIELINKSDANDVSIKNITRSNKSQFRIDVSMKNEENSEVVDIETNTSVKEVIDIYEKIDGGVPLELKPTSLTACSTPKMKKLEGVDHKEKTKQIEDNESLNKSSVEDSITYIGNDASKSEKTDLETVITQSGTKVVHEKSSGMEFDDNSSPSKKLAYDNSETHENETPAKPVNEEEECNRTNSVDNSSKQDNASNLGYINEICTKIVNDQANVNKFLEKHETISAHPEHVVSTDSSKCSTPKSAIVLVISDESDQENATEILTEKTPLKDDHNEPVLKTLISIDGSILSVNSSKSESISKSKNLSENSSDIDEKCKSPNIEEKGKNFNGDSTSDNKVTLLLSDGSDAESDNGKEYLNLNSDSDSSGYVNKEAKDMGEDYQSHDSMDENERTEMEENEIVDRGESLHSSDEEDNEPDDYEHDSFCVESRSEDEELLEGASDDLDSRSSSGLSDLSQSQTSKEKYNKKEKQKKRKSFVLNISTDAEDKNDEGNDDETENKIENDCVEVNQCIDVISDDDSVDEAIQNKYTEVLKNLISQNRETDSQESATLQESTEESEQNCADTDGKVSVEVTEPAESIENVKPAESVEVAESAESVEATETAETADQHSKSSEIAETIETVSQIMDQNPVQFNVNKPADQKKSKSNIVSQQNRSGIDPNKIDLSKIQATCEQILSEEKEKKRIRRESDSQTKKQKKPSNMKLKRLPEATLEELNQETDLHIPSQSCRKKQMRTNENLSGPQCVLNEATEKMNVKASTKDIKTENKKTAKTAAPIMKSKKGKEIKRNDPKNMLNEISNTKIHKTKKNSKSSMQKDVCEATTSFQVSPVNNKRKLTSDLPYESGFQVKKISSKTIETSHVGCTTVFKIESPSAYLRNINAAAREDLTNFKENTLFKGQIKRQQKGLIYSYRNKQTAMASRR